MAVAHDAVSESHTGITGSASEGSFTWEHNPAGTPKGILVFTFAQGTADIATGVTYGGTALIAVPGGRAVDTLNESGDCKAWFLGSSIPAADPAAVVVTRTNNADIMYAVAISVIAGADTEVTGVVLQQENQTPAEASVNDGSPGTNSLRYAGAMYGANGIPAAGGNSTALIGIDFGARTIGTVRETTAGQGARSVGFADAADDWACVLLAVREAAAVFPGEDEPLTFSFRRIW